MELTQQDIDKITAFNTTLMSKLRGVCRYLGNKEYTNQHTDDLYLMTYSWQIGIEVFTLYVNTNMTEQHLRYGWDNNL